MKNLKIAADLSLPIDTVTTALAILAIRGAGKSYTAAVLAEEVAGSGVPFVVIDPTGVWYGLRSSADGKAPGISVIVMGGNHGDIPLEETAGEVVADFVVSSGASIVLDLSLMRKGAQKRFVADFAEHLYHIKGKRENQTPLAIILDEADRFAPQKPQPEHARLLGAIEDWVRLGRSRGLGCWMITQRSAVLNKDVLTQVETLILLRTTSPQDRKAVGEWVKENATEEEFAEVMKTLSSIPNGTAWVWSPQVLGILKKVQIRTRRTFNSSATPKVGEKRIEPKVVAPVDLAALTGAIAATVERAKANDPKALKARIAALEVELKKRVLPAPAAPAKTVEVPVVTNAQVEKFEMTLCRAKEMSEKTIAAISAMGSLIAKASIRNPAHDAPLSPLAQIARRGVDMIVAQEKKDHLENFGGVLRAGERRIIRLLAGRESMSMSRVQVGTLTGIKPSGSTMDTYLGVLRRAGLIVLGSNDDIILTAEGRVAAGTVTIEPTDREEVLRLWSSKLRKGEREILERLVRRGEATRDALGADVGITPNGSTMDTYLGVLRRNGLIVIERGIVWPNSEVFS